MTKLVAEIRNLNRAISDHLAKVQIGDLAAPKSPQRRSAAVARWGANRPPKKVG